VGCGGTAELRGELREPIPGTGGQHHAPTVFDGRLGGCGADAGRRAGDQQDRRCHRDHFPDLVVGYRLGRLSSAA
jgi:hypothetical protein